MSFVILEIASLSMRVAASVGLEPFFGSLGVFLGGILGVYLWELCPWHQWGVSERNGHAWGRVTLMSVRVCARVCARACVCTLCFCSHSSPPPFEHVWGVSSQVSLQRPGTWSPLSLDREVSWSGAKAPGSSVVLGEKVVEQGDLGAHSPQGYLCPSQMPGILREPPNYQSTPSSTSGYSGGCRREAQRPKGKG